MATYELRPGIGARFAIFHKKSGREIWRGKVPRRAAERNLEALEAGRGILSPREQAEAERARKNAPAKARRKARGVAKRVSRKAATMLERIRGAMRKNPPLEVRAFVGRKGHLVSDGVISVAYYHAASAQAKPYQHVFDEPRVEMWALADGSILLRHPSRRLWSDFLVRDDE